jgi:biopolymer transport protein ExbD
MSHRKQRRAPEGVELNLAAMLDMAFQLLTFFILTFRPAPLEAKLELEMPSARPREVAPQSVAADAGLSGFTVSVSATPDGRISQLAVAGTPARDLGDLESRLRTVLGNRQARFDQVTIVAARGLRYDALMNVLDICARQRLAGGEPLSKVSLVEQRSDSG